MHASRFDLHMILPADVRFARMVRDVTAHGARQAGSSERDAAAFAGRVEQIVRERLTGATRTGTLSVAVRRSTGPMEVSISDGRRTWALRLEG
ncbi:MAG: hypothetical protein HY657_08800 [Acidobacteria bacterium]|nr:hypothetical protein [Acidobacteriota bacterium]